MKQKPNRLFSRAAMVLLLMLLTATTAWAEEVMVPYAVTYNTTKKQTTLTHNDGNRESVTWDYMSGINSTPWNGGATYGVGDGYGITFKPDKYLTLVGSEIRTSAETKFTVTVSGTNAYYIKSVGIDNVTATADLHAKTIEVTVPDNTYIRGFNVTLIRYHTVTPASGLHVTSGTSATSGGTTYYKPGTIVTVEPTNTHHIVEGTGGTGSASVSVASDKRSFSFTMPDQDVSPTATLTEVYRVSPASGITLSPAAYFTYGGAQYYKPNTTITLSSTVPTGQHVIYKAGNKTLAGNTYTVNSSDGDVTLTAEYPYNTYTVQFNGNGSTSGSMSNQSFTYATAQNLTDNAFTRTGYTFAGWNTKADGSGTSYINQQSVNNLTTTNGGTVTLYAQWTANTYTVTLNKQDGNGGSASATATYDAAMPAITVPTRTGYTFGGYFTQTNGGGTQYYNADGTSTRTWNLTAATTLYAKWTIKQYTITFVTGNGGTAINPITQDYNTSITAPADPERTGYTFAGWNPDIPTMMPAGDMTVTAQWTPIDYDINYDLNGGELPSQQSNPATYNVETNTFTLINPTRKGYTFAGWTEGNGTTRQTTVTITKGSTTGALTYTAHWMLNTYTITYNLVYGNVATANKTTYTVEDDDFTLNNPTKDHFTFTGWMGSNGTTPQTAVTITKGSYAEDLCYTANYAVGAHDGTCGADGADVYYAYDSSTNTFEIFGTGDMKDYDRDTDRPWNGYRADITTVVIGNGVKSIGSLAFYDCSSLTSITIPASVTNISDNAFNKCSSLASITIPTGVTSIGNIAFRNCTALTSIEIPTSVTSIGMLAFSNCSSLTGITIPDGVTSIGRGTFEWCSSLTSIEIPAKVTSIGFGAFQNCTSLTSINIPDGVTIIDNDVFNSCTSLTSITIPNGVTSIGSLAFSTCTSLASIHIPASVTSIGINVFWGCSGLNYITVESGNTKYDSRNDCNALIEKETNKLIKGSNNTVIPDNVTTIGSEAFVNCTGLKSIEIPASVTTIGKEAFSGCSGLESISVASGNTVYYSEGNCMIETASHTLILGCKNTVIPNSVKTIGDHAFKNCRGLTGITIPASVTSIDGCAFEGCTALASIEIPASVTSIGGYAFKGCTALTSITILDGVTSIGGNAFEGCTALASITIPASVTSIDGEVFCGCTSLASISVAAENTTYDSRNNCNAIIEKETNKLIVGCKNSVIPDDVTSIGKYAFKGCTGLTSIEIPASMTYIGVYAFQGCTSLTSVTIYPPSLPGTTMFGGNASDLKIYVFSDCVDTYKGHAPGMGADVDDILPIESISLKDAADNSSLITAADGASLDVTLKGRTLYKDGKWNTLCLPFNVVLKGSPLEGATARPLKAASITGTTLNLTFGDAVDAVDELVAGTPYIIKWESGDDIVNPVFEGVTIDATDPSFTSGDTQVSFLGTYKSTTYTDEDKSILFLGADNTLYYPQSGATIGACRAYFKIVEDDAPQPVRKLMSFRLVFGNDETLSGSFAASIQRGDANADGSISVTDIAVVVNCILQLDNTGGFSDYGADANGDGDITVTDIGVIVDKILGSPSPTPPEGGEPQ